MRINDKDNYNRIKDTITMNNLRDIINERDYTITKVAMNSKISDSTIVAYTNGQKIPSVPTLVSMGDFLNCNLDYLLDRTNNPISINDINKLSSDVEMNKLIQNILSLPNDKKELVKAYVKGLLNK